MRVPHRGVDVYVAAKLANRAQRNAGLHRPDCKGVPQGVWTDARQAGLLSNGVERDLDRGNSRAEAVYEHIRGLRRVPTVEIEPLAQRGGVQRDCARHFALLIVRIEIDQALAEVDPGPLQLQYFVPAHAGAQAQIDEVDQVRQSIASVCDRLWRRQRVFPCRLPTHPACSHLLKPARSPANPASRSQPKPASPTPPSPKSRSEMMKSSALNAAIPATDDAHSARHHPTQFGIAPP